MKFEELLEKKQKAILKLVANDITKINSLKIDCNGFRWWLNGLQMLQFRSAVECRTFLNGFINSVYGANLKEIIFLNYYESIENTIFTNNIKQYQAAKYNGVLKDMKDGQPKLCKRKFMGKKFVKKNMNKFPTEVFKIIRNI